MLEDRRAYKIIVALSLCILLAWVYFTNEETFLGYMRGRFVIDLGLVWQIGIFALLAMVLFYLMYSTLDYKNQNDALKKYVQDLQQELDAQRESLKELKLEFNEELMRLESFTITISDMARQVSSVLETEQLLGLILRKAVDLLGSQRCAIFKVDRENDRLLYIDSVGYIKKDIEKLNLKADEESGQIGLAAETGTFISRNLISHDPIRSYVLSNDKIEAEYCQPIVHNAGTLAVICVGDVSKNLTSQQTVRLLSTLANFGAVALTNTNLVDRIREQSIRDSLTWLYNHRFFQERMDILLNEAVRKKEAMGLVMLDLDNFKQLNDTHGHQTGDFVLRNAADIINSELKSTDIAARYGGEEFVVILPHRDDKGSYDIAEKIRKRFGESSFEFEGQNLSVTISAGVTAFNPSREKQIEKNVLINRADEALYKAKEEGRNKVIIYKGLGN